MKASYFITFAIAIALAFGLFLTLQPKLEKGTWVTAPKMLQVHRLNHLPKLFEPNTGDATLVFEEVCAYGVANKKQLEAAGDHARDENSEFGERSIELILKLHAAGTVPAKELDKSTPVAVSAVPTFGDGPLLVALCALKRAEAQLKNDPVRAEKVAAAVWCLGTTMFDKSRRYPIRMLGLTAIEMVVEFMDTFTKGQTTQQRKNVEEWVKGLPDWISSYWAPKLAVTKAFRPVSFGDLVKMSEEDKDMSWRIEATLTLGRMKFKPGRSSGDDAGMRAAIQKAMKSTDPDLAAAGKVAEAFTADDVLKFKG
jgi:hypothetical protein